jgi:hypothetical protein
MRWLKTLVGGYAGAGTVAFLFYRATYLHNRKVRAWAEHRGRELEQALDRLRADLLELRRQVARGERGGGGFDGRESASPAPSGWRSRRGATAP